MLAEKRSQIWVFMMQSKTVMAARLSKHIIAFGYWLVSVRVSVRVSVGNFANIIEYVKNSNVKIN